MEYSYSYHDRRLPEPHSSSYHKLIHSVAPLASSDTSRAATSPQFRGDEPASSTSTVRETRKPSSSAVVACHQCRGRKIRCDSTRPMCHNCVKRGNECEYDPVPKRRGPDKHPGTRQRSCKKRPAEESGPKKKRKVEGTPETSVKESAGERRSPPLKMEHTNPLLHVPSPTVLELPVPGVGPEGLVHAMDVSSVHRSSPHAEMKVSPTITAGEYSRKTWWDELVETYSSSQDQSAKNIIEDLSFLFNTTNLLLSFINVPLLVRSLNDPAERGRMQPALIYAALAVATLLKASEIELGASGRNRALWFRQAAQNALENSWSSQWIDPGLAAAALLCAIFESSAHPQSSSERLAESLSFLDSIIRTLNLTALDAHEPDVSTFVRGAVPVVYRSSRYPPMKECLCRPQEDPAEQLTYAWTSTPVWEQNWSDAEVKREECRRLCWSALSLASEYVSRCTFNQEKQPNFFLTEPANYKLLFPGEVLSRSPVHNTGQSLKEFIWALHCCCMLLWNACQVLRDTSVGEDDGRRVEFTVQAWGEADAISDAIDRHICNMDTALIHTCRELVYKSVFSFTLSLRGSQFNIFCLTGFSVVHYQEQLAKQIKVAIHHLSELDGHLLTRRPFGVTWFANQVATCLSLWTRNRTLVHALELAKSFLVPLYVLNALWPSPSQKRRCNDLRESLGKACASTGIPPPLPAHLSLPPMLHQ
ncbi:hypothetical protein NEOLEDRAFT_1080339 [Neolentinus lepideus HHB14362 ss-1]|uniref:Zn(2)-C6 fungal-type domain-containing protein n=1 Tax=Neolentinus lepideus HHB14362 ss-1 TaxID=1314782 RepID=A0A165MJN9_9AGAM|nr:hypothetical protein NEOLEDRAFT_1080339 [Neolentinus lepideus HHB14362 ss-1]